ncbi:MAG TPA: hypothetical protein VLM85_07000 [Polyangiaceae bacterium]|nr:hypothetical protein [Polyangiaceae bacterium]
MTQRLSLLAPFLLAFALAACGSARYEFSGPSIGVGNPASGAAPNGAAVVARDGRTKHRWTTFDENEACFESQLDDMKGMDARELRYELVGFRDESQPLSEAPTIPSSRVLLKDESQAVIQTTERPLAIPSATLDIFFASPSRVVTPQTKYVVLRVPWTRDDQASGAAGSRDGVWRLEK